MKNFLNKFWLWYERHYALNVGIASGLFLLQLIHLYWLSSNVVAVRLFGESFFHVSRVWELVIIFVDYTEIPALLSTSLVYINELRKGFNWRAVWFLIFLNSQWLHIFWITDEFVVNQFGAGTALEMETSTILPAWLAWVAIFIDYLELPVIADTIKRFFKSVSKKMD